METSFAAKPHQAKRLKARKYLQDLSRYEVKVKVTSSTQHKDHYNLWSRRPNATSPLHGVKVREIFTVESTTHHTLPPKEGNPTPCLQHLHTKVGEDFHIKVNSRSVSSQTFLSTRGGNAPSSSHMHVATYVVKDHPIVDPFFKNNFWTVSDPFCMRIHLHADFEMRMYPHVAASAWPSLITTVNVLEPHPVLWALNIVATVAKESILMQGNSRKFTTNKQETKKTVNCHSLLFFVGFCHWLLRLTELWLTRNQSWKTISSEERLSQLEMRFSTTLPTLKTWTLPSTSQTLGLMAL